MEYIRELHNYGVPPDEADKVAKEYITKERLRAIRSAIEAAVDDEFVRLSEYATDYISGVAAERAANFLRAVLDGEENAARRLLACSDEGSRYRQEGLDKGTPWAEMHHTWIFETSGIRLRREIVDAHPDLLKTERIKDLESVVEGLRLQVVKLKNQLDEANRQYR